MIKMTNVSKEWKIVWETQDLVNNSFVNFIKHKFESMPSYYVGGIPGFSSSNLFDVIRLKDKLLEYDSSLALARGGFMVILCFKFIWFTHGYCGFEKKRKWINLETY